MGDFCSALIIDYIKTKLQISTLEHLLGLSVMAIPSEEREVVLVIETVLVMGEPGDRKRRPYT